MVPSTPIAGEDPTPPPVRKAHFSVPGSPAHIQLLVKRKKRAMTSKPILVRTIALPSFLWCHHCAYANTLDQGENSRLDILFDPSRICIIPVSHILYLPDWARIIKSCDCQQVLYLDRDKGGCYHHSNTMAFG
jgi:hypothetical protein